MKVYKENGIKQILDGISKGKYKVIDGKLFNKNGKKLGVKTPKGHIQYTATINGKSVTILAHRFMYYFYNHELRNDMNVFHLNGDKTDNRPQNLVQIHHSVSGKIGKGNNDSISKADKGIKIAINKIENGEWKINNSFELLAKRKNGESVSIGHVKKRSDNTHGYKVIHLKDNGETYTFYLHQLIYKYFKGDLPFGMVINHKDGNSLNNNPENLEPVTTIENSKHAHDNHLIKYKRSDVV